MTRRGLQKVRTGCLTCKIRRVKCDEGRPECLRCKSTGRCCDGYTSPPPGSYSWDYLLGRSPRFALTSAPGTDRRELQSLAFFRHVVAPSLSGPLDSSFWTYTVSQVAHSEPAARHAVLAITSLYRAFDAQPQDAAPDSSHGGTAIAIHNYNAAIRNIAQHPTDLDAVLLVCALFVCIEFLRGNAQAAISHAAHGISLLNSSPQKSEFTPIFRHLSIFPMFFGASVSSFPVMAESESHVDAFRFTELPDALESLDALLARSVRLVRVTGSHRLGMPPEHQSLEVSLHEQHALQSDLGRWWKSFSAIRDQDRYATGHDTTFQVLEMRYLVAEIWTSACLDEDEAAYDAHHEKFKRIVEIATEAHHDLKTHSARGNKFTFSMGFCPLLQFVVLKCRYLKVRIAALALMKTLASQREALWDYEIMHAVGRRIIEIEHGVCVAPPEEVRYQDLEDGVQALSDDGLRVLDNSLVSEQTDKGGSKGVVGRTICLLLRRSGGEVEVRYDQLNLGSGW